MRPVRQRQPVEFNKFVGGIITEASPLNFPVGASLDEENFVINRDGSRHRRLGFDQTTSLSVTLPVSTTYTGVAISNFLWTNVQEDPSKNYLVHQYGHWLYFIDMATVSAVGYTAGLSLTTSDNTRFSFASIQGNLVVAVGDQTLRIYRGTLSGTVTFSRLQVRDFWGIDDTLATDERFSGTFSSTVGARHAYNLYNQGWPPEFFCSSDPENPTTMNNGTVEDPVVRTQTALGKYPSNADVMFSAMTNLTNGRRAYYPHALNNIVAGNTPAANGHYVIDLFNRSQGRIDTYQADQDAGWTARFNFTSYVPTDQSTGGIKAIAAYAGRIWYACSAGETGGDSRSPHIGTFVLFSQLVDSVEDLAKCYQEADPTAEDISDLIATDGGYIQLPDAVNIKALVPFKATLLVFADNGVWQVQGGDNGFTATEYQTAFLTNNGALSEQSIVVTPDFVLYWSRNGIFLISDELQGANIQSITQYTIQTLYDDIPYNSKKWAVGVYDDVNYKVRWLYQNTFDAAEPNAYTHELILDFFMAEAPANASME